MSDWRLIKSAHPPADTWVLVWDSNDKHVFIAMVEADGSYDTGESYGIATHWMPLPKGPE